MQVVDACLCDPLVSRLPGACTPEVTTALAEPKGEGSLPKFRGKSGVPRLLHLERGERLA